jgi:hypothetical protein
MLPIESILLLYYPRTYCTRDGALGRELLDMLGWPDARRDSLLLEHLQRGSCRAPEPGGWPLLTEAEAFGSLGRREQFERLAGVVDLLGAASGPEGQPRAHANPFCCVYGPMSADTGCILLYYDLNENRFLNAFPI